MRRMPGRPAGSVDRSDAADLPFQDSFGGTQPDDAAPRWTKTAAVVRTTGAAVQRLATMRRMQAPFLSGGIQECTIGRETSAKLDGLPSRLIGKIDLTI